MTGYQPQWNIWAEQDIVILEDGTRVMTTRTTRYTDHLTPEQSAGIRARNKQHPPQPSTPEHHYRHERWQSIR